MYLIRQTGLERPVRINRDSRIAHHGAGFPWHLELEREHAGCQNNLPRRSRMSRMSRMSRISRMSWTGKETGDYDEIEIGIRRRVG